MPPYVGDNADPRHHAAQPVTMRFRAPAVGALGEAVMRASNHSLVRRLAPFSRRKPGVSSACADSRLTHWELPRTLMPQGA